MIASWNIRGLNDPPKQSEIKNLIAKNRVALMGVLETRVREENMEKVLRGIGLKNWDLITNYNEATLGRIWILFDPRVVQIQVEKSTTQLIHWQVQLEYFRFCWTIVYGHSSAAERVDPWNSLTQCATSTKCERLI